MKKLIFTLFIPVMVISLFLSLRGRVFAQENSKNQELMPDLNLDELLQRAKSPDPYVRLEGVMELHRWNQNLKVEEVLRSAVHDEIWFIRRNALALGYGKIEDSIDLSRDEDPVIRVKSIDGLIQFENPRKIELLIDRLYDPYGRVVYDALIALGKLKDQRAIKPILEFFLSHKEWEDSVELSIRSITGEPLDKAMKAYLAELKPAPEKRITFRQVDVSSQIKRLQSGRAERISAVLRLAWADDPEGVKALIHALKDNEPTVRSAAAEALGALPFIAARATELVLSSLMAVATTDPDPSVRKQSMNSAGKFLFSEYRDQAIDLIRKAALNEKDPSVRIEAIRPLSGVRNRRTIEIMIDFLNDSSPEVRAQAANGIYLICLPEAIGSLITALKDPEPIVRKAAANSLAQAQDRKALRPLIDVLKDKDERVRLAAAHSLGSLKEPEAIRYLKEVAKSDPSGEVQRAANQSIMLIENERFSLRRGIKMRCKDGTSGESKGMKS